MSGCRRGEGKEWGAVRVADAERGRGARLGRGRVRTAPNPLPQFSFCSFGPRTPQHYRLRRLIILMKTASVHPGFSYNRVLFISGSCPPPRVCKCLIDLSSPVATAVLRRCQVAPDASPFANIQRHLLRQVSILPLRCPCSAGKFSHCPPQTPSNTPPVLIACVNVFTATTHTRRRGSSPEISRSAPARRIAGATPWTSDFGMNAYRPLACLAH